MTPGMIAGLGQAGVGALQAGVGLFGMRKRRRAADSAFNAIETYSESPYAKENLQAAKLGVLAPMPGETEAKTNIGQSTAQAVGAVKSKKGGLQAIAALNENQQKALQGLGVQKAQFKLGAQSKLAQANRAMTQEYGKAFESKQQKQAMKYQQALSELLAQKQMISQGLSGIGAGFANAAKFGSGGSVGGSVAKDEGASAADSDVAFGLGLNNLLSGGKYGVKYK